MELSKDFDLLFGCKTEADVRQEIMRLRQELDKTRNRLSRILSLCRDNKMDVAASKSLHQSTATLDTLKLVKTLLENGEFYQMKVECPECHGIEDEQYCCTTCWRTPNTEIPVRELMEDLVKAAESSEATPTETRTKPSFKLTGEDKTADKIAKQIIDSLSRMPHIGFVNIVINTEPKMKKYLLPIRNALISLAAMSSSLPAIKIYLEYNAKSGFVQYFKHEDVIREIEKLHKHSEPQGKTQAILNFCKETCKVITFYIVDTKKKYQNPNIEVVNP